MDPTQVLDTQETGFSQSESRWIVKRIFVNDYDSVMLFTQSLVRKLQKYEKMRLVSNLLRYPTLGRKIIPSEDNGIAAFTVFLMHNLPPRAAESSQPFEIENEIM